jgi:hypothetical protein
MPTDKTRAWGQVWLIFNIAGIGNLTSRTKGPAGPSASLAISTRTTTVLEFLGSTFSPF